MIRIFLDSSALFAAVFSSTGAARELLRLSINGKVKLIISPDVVTETQRNLSRKAPEFETILERLLNVVEFEIVPRPTKEEVWTAEAYVAQKDAFIIAAANNSHVDYLATFDRKHLIDPPEVSQNSELVIVTPGEVLKRLRS